MHQKTPIYRDFNNLTANLNFGTLELHFIPQCSMMVEGIPNGLVVFQNYDLIFEKLNYEIVIFYRNLNFRGNISL